MAGQQFSTNSLGGFLSQPYLTQRLRAAAQPQFRFRQFIDVKEAIGRNRGDTWLFDKRGNVATQGTVLSETNTMPQTNFSVGQGTGIIVEYGNSVPLVWGTLKKAICGNPVLQIQILRVKMLNTWWQSAGKTLQRILNDFTPSFDDKVCSYAKV